MTEDGIDTVQPGYFRGDVAAAKYLDMDRKTFARLMKKPGGVRPAIRGGFRYWSRAKLDSYMAGDAGNAYTVRPKLAARNRERASKATVINKAEQHTEKQCPQNS